LLFFTLEQKGGKGDFHHRTKGGEKKGARKKGGDALGAIKGGGKKGDISADQDKRTSRNATNAGVKQEERNS